MLKKTLILGASARPDRYSYMALRLLTRLGHPVLAIGNTSSVTEGVTIHDYPIEVKDIDTVTLYLNPKNQLPYYDYILSLHPKRVIFNPGTENPDLEVILQNNDIQCLTGCTLVMLQTRQY